MQTIIDSEFNGRTVKDWLYKNTISAALVTRLKKLPDGIMVNGEKVTVRYKLKSGDILSLGISDRAEDESEQLAATEMPLDIIYEDDDMIAVNKAPGVPTHPSHGHFTDTLANGLKYYFSSRNIPFVFRAVNRLDRNTSGIVITAKNQHTASELSSLLQRGKIRKTYIALLGGSLKAKEGVIDLPIRRAKESIIFREVCDITAPGAKEARTAYKTIGSLEGGSIVSAEPITGRTHQLRVHFSALGAPIIGDDLYGSAEKNKTELDLMISRHALHAVRLTIEREDRTIDLFAPIPSDMMKIIREKSTEEITLDTELK